MVSKTVSRGQEAGHLAGIPSGQAPPGRPRSRGRLVALGVVVAVAAGAVAAWRAGAFSPAGSPGTGQQGAPPPATKPVMREDLSATTPVTATLGYAGSYPVTGHGDGTLTWLPSPGRVIGQGQALYQTGNGSPVVLLYGSVPDWRTPGRRARPGRTWHSSTTTWWRSATPAARMSRRLAGTTTPGRRRTAMQKLEGHLGVSAPPGSLSLGQVVFEPEALRVAQVTGQAGRPGVRAGADGDLGPARGDYLAGCLRSVGGQGG